MSQVDLCVCVCAILCLMYAHAQLYGLICGVYNEYDPTLSHSVALVFDRKWFFCVLWLRLSAPCVDDGAAGFLQTQFIFFKPYLFLNTFQQQPPHST